MKAPIFCMMTVVLFSGCQTSSNIVGIYSNAKDLNRFELYSDSTFAYTSLRYRNSSFTDKSSDGRWKRIDKNTIVLNSRITDNTIPLQVEIIDTGGSSIRVCENLNIVQKKSRYKYENEDFAVIPYIDKSNYLELHPELSDEPLQITKNEFRIFSGLEADTINSHEILWTNPPIKRGSYCIYPENSFSSLYFEIKKQPKTVSYSTYYTLQTEKMNTPIHIGMSVKVDISIADSLFSYRIFNNTKLKIKGNKLIFKDEERDNKKSVLYLKK